MVSENEAQYVMKTRGYDRGKDIYHTLGQDNCFFINLFLTFAAAIFISKMSITKEKRASIFAEFGGNSTNTGSIEGQIALLTERINDISSHLSTNKKDFSTQKGLMHMVGQRKRLLTYLSKHNLTGYRQLIEKLGLRK